MASDARSLRPLDRERCLIPQHLERTKDPAPDHGERTLPHDFSNQKPRPTATWLDDAASRPGRRADGERSVPELVPADLAKFGPFIERQGLHVCARRPDPEGERL